MAPINRTKVIVAGGGVAGLAIANMLELTGIDYVVLEKYGEIAPNVGASIGLFPNGCRILDQLGCYDQLEDLVAGNLGKDIVLRNCNGKRVATAYDFNAHMTARFGYKGLWLDRQNVLRILYDNLKDKSKIVVNRGITRVEQQPDGVQVVATDGSIIHGEVLVGADGFHSIARKEMWRIADEECPGYFSSTDQRDVACEYSCVFGISMPPAGFEFAVCDNIMGKDHSFIFATGPEKRVYWFLFSKRSTERCGLHEKAPRYSSSDKDLVIQAHLQDRVSETLVFKDLWDTVSFSTLVPIPEYVFEKWHYGRIMTVGDAAHKFNPMIGQGGNCAIETCAVLVNNLHKLLSSKGQDHTLTMDELSHVFKQTQATQHARVLALKRESHIFQSVQANDNILSKMLAKILPPLADTDLVTALFTDRSLPGPRLDMVDVPMRNRHEAYLDERPSRPRLSWIPLLVTTGLLLRLFVYMIGVNLEFVSSCKGVPCMVSSLFSKSVDQLASAISWTHSRTAATAVDVQATDDHESAQAAYLPILIFSLLFIWTIDGHRYSNKNAIFLRYITPVLCVPLGVSIVGPVHYLASAWNARQDLGGMRAVPAAVARSVLPAVLLAFAAPTLLLLSPALSTSQQLWLATAWPITPAVAVLLVFVFARVAAASNPKLRPNTNPDLAQYAREDLPILRTSYLISFLVAAAAHFAFLVHLSGGSVDLTMVLQPLTSGSEVATAHVPAHVDLVAAVSLVGIYGLYWIIELRNRGMVTSRGMLAALICFIAAQPVAGPGAAYIGLWWWRENVLAAGARLDCQAQPQGKKQTRSLSEKSRQSDCAASGAALLR